MKLIFIRHAEPDYSCDSLTKKGFREAKCLVPRTSKWNVDQFYCSPLGRAQATAAPTLEHFGIPLTTTFPNPAPDVIQEPDSSKAIVYPWLRELHAPIDPKDHPEGKTICWDFPPSYLNDHPILFDPNHWKEDPLMIKCDVVNQYEWITKGLDGLLSKHGFTRDGLIYRTDGTKRPSDAHMEYNDTTIECMKNAEKEETVVVFCHLGVMMIMISHLINSTPMALIHGVFVPPASITILSTEERHPGEAYFRIQSIGDTGHFRDAGEPVSYYGGFSNPFQM